MSQIRLGDHFKQNEVCGHAVRIVFSSKYDWETKGIAACLLCDDVTMDPTNCVSLCGWNTGWGPAGGLL